MSVSVTQHTLLHLMLSVNETSAPYNEHILPGQPGARVAGCSYFPPTIPVRGANHQLWHGGGSWRGFLRAVRAAAETVDPDVVHAHFPHVALLWSLSTLFTPRRRRPATVLTVHTSFPNLSARNLFLLLLSFLAFERVVFCSRASRDSFPSIVRRLLGRRATIVPNGVALERLDTVRRLEARPGRRATVNLFVVGRLIPIKSPFVVLDAFSRLRDPTVRLVLLGDGPLRRSLETWAAARGLRDRVEFRGLVGREEVYRAFASEADIYLSMSQVEGLPLAAMEALASAVPAILSDIASHREIAEGLEVGVQLVTPGRSDDLVTAIQAVLAAGPDGRHRAGARAREHIVKTFGLGAMQRRYADVYDELLESRGANTGRARHSSARPRQATGRDSSPSHEAGEAR